MRHCCLGIYNNNSIIVFYARVRTYPLDIIIVITRLPRLPAVDAHILQYTFKFLYPAPSMLPQIRCSHSPRTHVYLLFVYVRVFKTYNDNNVISQFCEKDDTHSGPVASRSDDGFCARLYNILVYI